MPASLKPIGKTCEYCEKVLHGRVDMRFCNDTCRNQFNRRKRSQNKIHPHKNAADIVKIIKRNYEILKEGIPGQLREDEFIQCGTSELMQSGLNLKYYTGSFSLGNQQWYCIFDRCYCISGDTTIIQDFPEQAAL
jgi:hypothetical protein